MDERREEPMLDESLDKVPSAETGARHLRIIVTSSEPAELENLAAIAMCI